MIAISVPLLEGNLLLIRNKFTIDSVHRSDVIFGNVGSEIVESVHFKSIDNHVVCRRPDTAHQSCPFGL